MKPLRTVWPSLSAACALLMGCTAGTTVVSGPGASGDNRTATPSGGDPPGATTPGEKAPASSSGAPATPPSSAAWTGQKISVVLEGRGDTDMPDGTGVEIVVDPKATAVSASFVAKTPPKGLPPLRPPYLSVTDKNGVIDVHCVRGQLDCSTLTVTIPSGTPSEPLRLTVESSKYGVHASGATATVASLVVRSTGHGDVAFDVAPTLGASIDITGSGNLMDVTLPPTFAADEVTLINHEAHGYLDVTDFLGLDAGSTFGPAGTGVKLLRLDATFDIAVHKQP